MRHNPGSAITDPQVVADLIREHPWATLVSSADGSLIASHYPVLLDEGRDDLCVVTHVGRPDEKLHGIGAGAEMLIIFAGAHGYVSPSWYVKSERNAPTWNYSVAHCYGVPEVLSAEENLLVLNRLTDHFEREVDEPFALDPEESAQIARGTVGLRIPISRFVCKVKMSENKSDQTRRQVIEALRTPGPYASDALADDMQRSLDAGR
jgi:transcriptional regulator